MKLEFQSRWFRVLIELFPAAPGFRRYRVRVAPTRLDGSLGRLLCRRIERRVRNEAHAFQ